MAGGDMDDSFHDTYAEKPWNACSKHVNDRYEWRGAAVVFYEREGSKKILMGQAVWAWPQGMLCGPP
jgi:hypothetical protein